MSSTAKDYATFLQMYLNGGELNGIRFLADHLRGDAYFRVHRPGQNLDRARVQLRLLESIERQEDAMTRLVTRVRDERKLDP